MTRDHAFADIITWLRAHGLEASTDRHGRTVIRQRRVKRSRLTGEVK